MRIFGMGLPEIIIILVVIFVIFFIFGPKNLPKLGSAIGKAVKNLREGIGGKKKPEEVKDTKEKEDDGEVIEVIDKPKPSAQTVEVDNDDDVSQKPVSKPKPKSRINEDILN